MTNVKGGGKLSLGGIKDNLIMGGTYKEVCTPIFVTVCAGGGDPYVEECGEPEYIGDECHDEWVESEDPVDPPDPNDDPCSDPANFYICNPENPSNPEIPGEPAAEDPCDRLAKVKANDDNENLNAQNEDIHDHITPGGNEYGADQKLRSLTAGDYKISPVTPGTPDSWQPNFTWNSTDGYSTGHAHSHTDGTAPSPQDVF